ncbi:M56 family metallopeptidase [Amycolatopsis anabasis]|uniref:M56 family metallopeptidase n=1 Tax=Amycolatopsis anabasis TaxID=1840409 RepID=UPI001FE54059|nr:M56 family metallopeptidase [Amycolatopsis anabasis]
MSYVLHHLVTLLFAAVAMVWLPRGRWTHSCPRTALVLWQLVVLSAVVSLVGALLGAGLAPYGRGVVPGFLAFLNAPGALDPVHLVAVLAGLSVIGLLVSEQVLGLLRTARARARHRRLLDLVASADGDAMVVGHSIPVAYCLPGRRPQIVISAGTRQVLSAEQLRAVLAHERAHVHERHHLLLEPFEGLRLLLPTGALAAIQLLVEMCADDRAARQHGGEALAGALERFSELGIGGTPAGAFAAASVATTARIQRLRHPRRAAGVLGVLAVVVAMVALATPVSLFALPA